MSAFPPKVGRIVDKLAARADPHLLAWLATRGPLVEAKIARADAPRTVKEVLDDVAQKNLARVGKDGFNIYGRYTEAGIRDARAILTAEGWRCDAPDRYGHFNVHPPEALVAAAKRDASMVLGRAPWRPPVPCQVDPKVLQFAAAGYFPVGDEWWVIPYVGSTIKGR
jgi:hypothetical protein